MTPALLDSLPPITSLEATAPPPREASGNDSFARHLNGPANNATPAPEKSRESAPSTPVAPRPSTEHRRETTEAVPSDELVDVATRHDDADPRQVPPGETVETCASGGTVHDTEDEEQGEATADEVILSAAVAALTTVAPPVEPKELAKGESAEQTKIAPDEMKRSSVVERVAKSKGNQSKVKPAAAQEILSAQAKETQESLADVKTESLSTEAAATVEEVTPFAEGEVSVESVVVAEQATVRKGAVRATKRAEEAAKDHQQQQKSGEPTDATDEASFLNIQPTIATVNPRENKRGRGEAKPATQPALGEDAKASTAATTTAPSTKAATTAIDAPVLTTPVLPTGETAIAGPPAPQSPTTTDAVTPNGSRLPQYLLARDTSRANRGAPVNPADQARFVQRVAKAFQTAHSGSGEIQLRLSPPALGSLKLEVKLQEGVLSARVETENTTAQSLLLDNLPALKERLAEQGIHVEKFDVDVRDQRSQGQPDSPQERERRFAQRNQSARNLPETETTTAETSALDPRQQRGPGRLNVTV